MEVNDHDIVLALLQRNERVTREFFYRKFHMSSSLIQTLLSVPELHRIGRRSGLRTVPPVGNFTQPRRFFYREIY